MAFYVIKHKVKDFSAWKAVYDDFEATRRKFGVQEHYAFQSVDDPLQVVVVGEGELANIQKFLNSDKLKSGMEKAGIVGAPSVFIGENTRG